MTIIKLILLVLCVFTLVTVAIDYLAHFFNRMKRYHIGQWDNEQQWKNAVRNRVYRWIKRVPAVPATDNMQYILWNVIRGKLRNATIDSWQTASLILGAVEIGNDEAKKVINCWIRQNINKDGTWKRSISKVDFASLGYAVLSTEIDPEKIKPAMEEIIKIIKANTCDDGMISYSQGSKTPLRYVDTLGMVCPFLAKYGEVFHEEKYFKEAYRQILEFRKHGMLANTEFPCHAYNADSKLPLGVYGWGRGSAWYFLATVNVWKSAPDIEEKKILEKWIYDAAEYYKMWQQNDGGFCSILQGGGRYDSSITSAMAYFYMMCFKIFQKDEYYRISKMCLNKLKTVTMKNGAVDLCQGDTHGIGVFSTNYNIMPFAQGLLLQTLGMEAGSKK